VLGQVQDGKCFFRRRFNIRDRGLDLIIDRSVSFACLKNILLNVDETKGFDDRLNWVVQQCLKIGSFASCPLNF
jgi:hypothetical protein